jgi:hypothetical protein
MAMLKVTPFWMNGVLTVARCIDDGVCSVRIHPFTEKPTLPLLVYDESRSHGGSYKPPYNHNGLTR